MPQYAPQLGTRIGLTGQFVANGREPCTPGALLDEPPDDDSDGEDAAGRVVRGAAEAVTAEPALRSRAVAPDARRDVERVWVALDAEVAGAAGCTKDAVAGAAGAAAAGAGAEPPAAADVRRSAWAAPSRSTT